GGTVGSGHGYVLEARDNKKTWLNNEQSLNTPRGFTTPPPKSVPPRWGSRSCWALTHPSGYAASPLRPALREWAILWSSLTALEVSMRQKSFRFSDVLLTGWKQMGSVRLCLNQ